MATPITCFKAYDIRGELNSQLTEDVAYRIGYAFAQELNAKTVVVGSDVRLTSTPLKLALSAGLIDAGATEQKKFTSLPNTLALMVVLK